MCYDKDTKQVTFEKAMTVSILERSKGIDVILFYMLVQVNSKATPYRGLISVGAVGAAAPTDFRKTDFAPTKILENLTFDSSFLV